jgi:hypothetical protein
VVAGLVVVAGYLLVGAVTLRLSGRHVRPLFDSFAGKVAYDWVCPPASLKATNTAPNPAQLPIVLTPAGSEGISASTDDGQILFAMSQGEVPAHGPDTSVLAKITPLCASKLSPVPSGYSPAGNAYRLALAYQPSGATATTTKSGNVIVRPPTSADGLAYSADSGKTWRLLNTFHSGTSIGASLTAPGVYLALQRGNGSGLAPPSSSGGSGTTPILIGVIVAIAAALIVGVVEFIRRRR